MPGVAVYENAFERFDNTGPAWLRNLRLAGIERFRSLGFPALREETWRFTRTRPIAEVDFALAPLVSAPVSDADIIARTFDDAGCIRVVLVNGRVDTGLSHLGGMPAGVRVESLAAALSHNGDGLRTVLNRGIDFDRERFVALNTAFLTDGVYIELARGTVLERPVHIVHVTSAEKAPVMVHPRVIISAERETDVSVVESYIGGGDEPYFTNAVTEISCGENASLKHFKLQREAPRSFHIAMQHATVAANAHLSLLNVAMGGSLARNDTHAVLAGEGIDARLDGLYLAGGRQHVDNQTHIRHASPRCHSFELYKGILNDHARGVFNGRIYVDPLAQKTDAKQQNNCMLLSDDARINSNPQLEIFADDVKCTHGAAIGKTDETALFYLRSRGIPAAEARDILVYAFASELFERVENEPLRTRLEADLFAWLGRSRSLQAA